MIDMNATDELEEGEIAPSKVDIRSTSYGSDKKEGRSTEAQQLHRLIMQACDARDHRELRDCLQRVSNYINGIPSSILLECGVNKNSHLDDALHLPFERQNNKRFAQEVSKKLLDLLVSKMKKRLHADEFPKLILGNKTNDGFMVLQIALASGNADTARQVIELLKEHPDALKANLKNVTKDGFMVLQHALASGNADTVRQVIALLEEYPDAARANLKQHNRFGYNCLHQAANSGNYSFVQQVVSLIERVFLEESAQVISDLKKDGKKFQAKAWQNPEIKAFLNKASSPPNRNDKSRDFYPRGSYRRQENTLLNHRPRNNVADNPENKRQRSSEELYDYRESKVQRWAY
jgi:hypothetical protein